MNAPAPTDPGHKGTSRLARFIALIGRLLPLLRMLPVLLLGVLVGAGAILLFLSLQRDASRALALGMGAFAFGCFATALLAWALRQTVGQVTNPETVARWLKDVAQAHAPSLAPLAASVGPSVGAGLRVWMLSLAMTALLSVAATLVATVVAVSQLVALHFQIDRMDRQNDLIRVQMEEQRSTAAGNLLAAQLPSLLEAIDRERSSKGEGEGEAGRRRTASPGLMAQINVAVSALPPRVRASCASQADPFLVSPERGVLLTMLGSRSLDLNWGRARPIFDHALIDGPILGQAGISNFAARLGTTSLEGADLFRAGFGGVDMVGGVLRSACLPPPLAFASDGMLPPARLSANVMPDGSRKPAGKSWDVDLDGAIAPESSWLVEVSSIVGGERFNYDAWVSCSEGDRHVLQRRRSAVDVLDALRATLDRLADSDPPTDPCQLRQTDTALYSALVQALRASQQIPTCKGGGKPNYVATSWSGGVAALTLSTFGPIGCLQQDGVDFSRSDLSFPVAWGFDEASNLQFDLRGLNLENARLPISGSSLLTPRWTGSEGSHRRMILEGARLPAPTQHWALRNAELQGAIAPTPDWLEVLASSTKLGSQEEHEDHDAAVDWPRWVSAPGDGGLEENAGVVELREIVVAATHDGAGDGAQTTIDLAAIVTAASRIKPYIAPPKGELTLHEKSRLLDALLGAVPDATLSLEKLIAAGLRREGLVLGKEEIIARPLEAGELRFTRLDEDTLPLIKPAAHADVGGMEVWCGSDEIAEATRTRIEAEIARIGGPEWRVTFALHDIMDLDEPEKVRDRYCVGRVVAR